MLVALRVTVFFLVCLLKILCCGNLVEKPLKNISGGVDKQHEAIRSVMKYQEVSESFRSCQEASGCIREALHENNNKQTNKIDWLWGQK